MTTSPAKAKRNAQQTRALLADTFPACFVGPGAEKRPLAIGIYLEIMLRLPEIGAHRLSAAMADYTSGPTYLRNVVEGAPRVGLNGEPKGAVTAGQAAHAAQRLAAFTGWVASQKKPAAKAKEPEPADA